MAGELLRLYDLCVGAVMLCYAVSVHTFPQSQGAGFKHQTVRWKVPLPMLWVRQSVPSTKSVQLSFWNQLPRARLCTWAWWIWWRVFRCLLPLADGTLDHIGTCRGQAEHGKVKSIRCKMTVLICFNAILIYYYILVYIILYYNFI